jgi:hypothetical protein
MMKGIPMRFLRAFLASRELAQITECQRMMGIKPGKDTEVQNELPTFPMIEPSEK